MRMIAKNPADRWPTLADAADALVEGLDASDNQMRRELGLLVQAIPDEAGRSLPLTPRSPTPPTILPESAGTAAMAAAPRVQDDDTQVLPAPPMRPTPVIAPARQEPAPRHRKLGVLAGLAAASIGIVAIIALTQGGGTDASPLAAAGPLESSVSAGLLPDSGSADLEASDSIVVRVGLDPITATLRVGDSLQLKATPYGPSGEIVRRSITWLSDDTLRVTVSRTGWVRALAPTVGGPVPISASADKRVGVALITVR
jgi:hypothetical protein